MAEGTQSVFIYNNTFYNHNTTKTGNVAHLWIDANNASIKVKNNIFFTDLNNDSGCNGLEIFSLTDCSKIEADYNLFYRTNSSLNIIKVNGVSYTSTQISSLRSATGWEKHSPAPSDPKFTNAALADFTLTGSSPALSKGINLNLPMDYAGTLFFDPPNLGCYSQAPNLPPVISIDLPVKNSTYIAPATVTINATAYDPDGSVVKVEFFNGSAKLGESTIAPYSFVWKNVNAGIYNLTAVATDNKDAKGSSGIIQITVSVLTAVSETESEHEEAVIFPNPNDGHFTIRFKNPLSDQKVIEVFNLAGQKLFNGLCQQDESEREFDLSSIPRGIYILRFSDSKNTSYRKFIKQ
jgi:hypothetical protein